jgi:hypothetical protein
MERLRSASLEGETAGPGGSWAIRSKYADA